METAETTPAFDIFLWANRADELKAKLQVELFLFNKNYTLYETNLSSDLDSQLRPLFLYDIIGTVNLGAGTGLSVRDFEYSDSEDKVLLKTQLENVSKAHTLIHTIKNDRSGLETFSDQEHDFKRIKGVVAQFSYPDGSHEPFYVVKSIQASQAVRSGSAWQLNGETFQAFQPEVGFKIPADSQVLIIEDEIYAFNPSKFTRLFGYDYKKQALAEKKVAEIEAQYTLSFPDGLDLQSLVKDRKSAVNKLQKIEVGEVSQEQIIEYADTMQLDLMTDDAGAIIIMDGNDLDTFVNLLNEDYVTSEITGKRYEIRSKKLLSDASGGEPPRG